MKFFKKLFSMFSTEWKQTDKNAPDFNKNGIEYTFNRNGGFEVNPYSLLNDPGFIKQVEAASKLEKLLRNKDGTYKSIPI